MSRSKRRSSWMRRHVSDPYVKEAVRQGYRSRAAFKLIELDQRERLLRRGIAVVDLGAAPGGWAQVAAQKVGSQGLVVAVDLLEVASLPGVTAVRGDVREAPVQAAVEAALAGRRADLVLSDMAPNLTGVKPADEARSQELVELAVDCARRWLKPEGVLLVKLFHGSGLDAVIRHMKEVFAEVGIRKPPASRAASAEVYALCRGLAR
jgi:23S rRNA (uridine2552-2'-O)-methyltransferase